MERHTLQDNPASTFICNTYYCMNDFLYHLSRMYIFYGYYIVGVNLKQVVRGKCLSFADK